MKWPWTRRGFDFKAIEGVDEATVEAFFASTHEGSRRLPLLVAQHVYAQLEDELTRPGSMDARRLSEIRGGMAALRAFAVAFSGQARRGQAKHSLAIRAQRSTFSTVATRGAR